MFGLVFVYCLLAYICGNALRKPYIGVMGYYGFILLQPEWNWRWSVPQGMGFQKYIVAATLIGCLAQGFGRNRIQGLATLGVCGLVAFLGLAFVSYLGSIAPDPTFFYMDALWKMILMAVIAVRTIDTPQKVMTLLWVLVLGQGFNAYRINESYFQYGVCFFAKRGYGPSGDNNLYCILTVPIMAVSAALAGYSAKMWQKLLAAAILLMQAHQIMLMESRGCMLGAIVMLVFTVLFIPKTALNVWAMIGVVTLTIMLAGPNVMREFNSSFEKEGERDSSAESRFMLWQAGWEITKDYPVLGVGPYAGQFLVPRYVGWGGGAGGGAKGLHNLFFEISTGCGIPALLCYLTYFSCAGWGALVLLVRRRRDRVPDWLGCLSLAVFPGMIGYFVSSMFSSGALLESSYALAAVGLAGTCVWAAEKRRNRAFSPQLAHFSQSTLGIPQVPGKLSPS